MFCNTTIEDALNDHSAETRNILTQTEKRSYYGLIRITHSLAVFIYLVLSGCTSNINLISEVGRLEVFWPIKHCKKIVHVTEHSILLTTCLCTDIHGNNFGAPTKVQCLRTIQSLPFTLEQYSQTKQPLTAKMTFQNVGWNTLLIW